MSKNANRYGLYRSTRVPREKKSILLPGSLDDHGRWYKCWNCGATCDSQREQTDTGQYGTSGVNVTSNLSLLLHMDGTNASTTFTDSSPYSNTMTASGDAQISTSQYKFGTASGSFVDSDDLVSTPDSSIFDLSDGIWSISFWIYGDWNILVPADEVVYLHSSGADSFSIQTTCESGTSHGVKLSIIESSVETLSLSTVTPRLLLNTWHHVEISEWNNLYMLTVDGQMGWKTESTVRPADYTGSVYIGGIAGYLDEFMVTKYVTHFGSFDVPTEAYDTDTYIPGSYYPDVTGGCWFCGSRNYR